MTLEEQRDAYRRELGQLDSARGRMLSGMHFSTVFDILYESKLPYTLVQDWRDLTGTPVRHGYRYRFTSDFASAAMLYVQETPAGQQYRSMHAAIAALRDLLVSRLREVENAIACEKEKSEC